MLSPNARTRIVHADPQLYEEALGFISEHYRAAFGTTPCDEPDHLFVALQRGEVVGTMGINVWHESQTLRLQKIYQFDAARAPLPVVPEHTIEYGRWIATVSGISDALIYRATQFAIDAGKRYGWCEHSKRVHRICLQMKLAFSDVQATLDHTHVAECDRAFYERNPDVKLYMVDLAAWCSTLKPYVCERESVVLD